MKRILLALALFLAILPAAPRAEAHTNVSIDFFYSNLGSDGYWLDVDGYGYCWQPTIAVSNRSWRPYSDGYWAYTDLGWTWVSYEPFGWATYHYGRWARLRSHGWVWVPGYEWAPAWVSWRVGGNYVGWAPLPPRGYSGRGEVVYQGRPIGSSVDIEFDIGPAYYNFVDVRYIGAPVLSRHIYAPTQNVTYINQTVNVTNITYQNSTVYNYGPDYSRLSTYAAQPIQRLNIERVGAVDPTSAPEAEFTKVQGNKLVVAAPPKLEQPEKPVAPPEVKTKVEEPNLETGWSEIADASEKTRLKEKIKKEDRKNIPPPEVKPENQGAVAGAQDGSTPPPPAPAGTTPATGAQVAEESVGTSSPDTAAAAGDRNKKEKGRVKRDTDTLAPAVAEDGAAQVGEAAESAKQSAGKSKDKGREKNRPAPQAPAVEQPVTAPAAGEIVPDSAAERAAAPAGREKDRQRAEKERGRGRGQRPDVPPEANRIAPGLDGARGDVEGAPTAVQPRPDKKEKKSGREKPGRPDRAEAPQPVEPAIEQPMRPQAPVVREMPVQREKPGKSRGGRAERSDDRGDDRFVPPPQQPVREEARQPIRREMPAVPQMEAPVARPQQAQDRGEKAGRGKQKKERGDEDAPQEE